MQTNKRRWRRPRDKLADFFATPENDNREARDYNETYTARKLGNATKDTQQRN